MGHKNLAGAVADLERHGHLKRIDVELDPNLEIPALHRRVSAAGGPALLFTRPKGCRFSLASNLFGTIERIRFLFRDTLDSVHRLMELQADPERLARTFWRYLDIPWRGLSSLPRVAWHSPVLANSCPLEHLPKVKCWPDDGGAFVTLPLVYSEDPAKRGWRHSNLGMYRVQLDGNEYLPNQEVGIHYQIHRGIGVHHTKAVAQGNPLGVNVIVGGPPAWTISAVMPLPEGIPEIAFAGVLAGRPVRLSRFPGANRFHCPVWSDADFAICGQIHGNQVKPEGPFGDHLGYYSLTHDFPVLKVDGVFHRKDAIWPFTVVGRPPQEDSAFGAFIHELTGDVIPSRLPGVKAVHAIDEAGVHPLLFALGSERYTPYQGYNGPAELLTQANLILGTGQLSLAKFLFILDSGAVPGLDIHNKASFLEHLFSRIDFTRDLHFQTNTTIDTLDYSGTGLNRGSKVVFAAGGPPIRKLTSSVDGFDHLPGGLEKPRLCFPGVLAVKAPSFAPAGSGQSGDIRKIASDIPIDHPVNRFAIICLSDDPDFLSANLSNWLWACFTRSDPARDLDGVGAFTLDKHWGCKGSLILDARTKPHLAPPLLENEQTTKRIEELATKGGPLCGLF
jgi:4-hydroxy-3-polyprenylbenzoate decarboxylase